MQYYQLQAKVVLIGDTLIVPVLGPIAGGMLGAVIYKVFYKGQFDLICAVGILLVIATLVLGLVLNKSNKSNDIESIY